VTFMPGVSGNPAGRRRGTKTRKQALVESLFEGEVAEIAQKALELARGGNTECIRIVLDRVAPLRRGRPVNFKLPAVSDAADIVKCFNGILRSCADGTLTIEEAQALASVVEAGSRAILVRELEERLERLEAQL
jgi:uncharacterized protein DUF5681